MIPFSFFSVRSRRIGFSAFCSALLILLYDVRTELSLFGSPLSALLVLAFDRQSGVYPVLLAFVVVPYVLVSHVRPDGGHGLLFECALGRSRLLIMRIVDDLIPLKGF